MALKIEILTPDDASKRFNKTYPVNKILGLAKRMDKLLDLLDAPVAIRIHSVKRTGPVTRGKKIELEYHVDHSINDIQKNL
ncbi:MAG: hypothetical protein HYT80_01350 [Euryarchaeota archaeon]|nr:hypothetical protein [Euryarchaeota archaeon]